MAAMVAILSLTSAESLVRLALSDFLSELFWGLRAPTKHLSRSYLRVPQAAAQVKILIFLVKIFFFPINLYANFFL